MSLLQSLYYITIAANMILGIYMVIKDYRSRVNITFALCLFLMAFWMYATIYANDFSIIGSPMSFFWIKLCYDAVIPIPALLLYFSLVFPESTPVNKLLFAGIMLPVPILYAYMSLGLLLENVTFVNGVIQFGFGNMHWAYVAYMILYFVAIFIVLLRNFSKSKGVARAQIQTVIVGLLVPFIMTGTVNIILPVLGITYEWELLHAISPVSILFFAIVITYSIVRYRFLGFNVILGKGIVYTALAGFIAALYFGFLFLITTLFQGISGNYSLLIGLLFFFIFAIVFEPLRDRTQNWVDQIFFKTKYDYEKTLRETSAAMSLLTDMERLLKLTARIITRRMKLSGAALFLYNEKRDRFEIRGADGVSKELSGFTMTSNYPIIEVMEETKKVILRSDIEEKLQDQTLSEFERIKYENLLSDFSRLHASLFVPSLLKNNLVAFLSLSDKLSGDSFTELDINFLTTLANQSAIFVENATLLEKEKDAAKKLAEAEAREKYTSTLEKMNRELIETREELVKAERLSTLTKLTVSLQHEINNPLTSVLAQTQGLLLKMGGEQVPQDFVKERLQTIEREAKRIRELLRNLANITEPIVREYMPGVDMIDISASPRE